MRARNIKPSFFDNEYLAAFGPSAQLLFVGLWCLADRDGKLEDRPIRIKAKIFPYYDPSPSVEDLLTMLAGEGEPFIVRYEVDGKRYIKIVNFSKHQRPHPNEKPSEIPDPPTDLQPGCKALSTKVESASSHGDHKVAPRNKALCADIMNPSSLNDDNKKQKKGNTSISKPKPRVPAREGGGKSRKSKVLTETVQKCSRIFKEIKTPDPSRYRGRKNLYNRLKSGYTYMGERRKLTPEQAISAALNYLEFAKLERPLNKHRTGMGNFYGDNLVFVDFLESSSTPKGRASGRGGFAGKSDGKSSFPDAWCPELSETKKEASVR